ncbi:MAG: hypothetical protein ACAH95_17695 [Fimbriimonas sp.]
MVKVVLLASLAAIAVYLGWSGFANREIDLETAVSNGKSFLKNFKPRDSYRIGFGEPRDSSARWLFTLEGSQHSYFFSVNRKSGGVESARSIIFRDAPPTQTKFLANESSAKTYMATIVKHLAGENPLEQDSFRFGKVRKVERGMLFSGTAECHFSPKIHGYGFLSGRYGLSLRVDTLDGSLVEFRAPADLPAVRKPSSRLLTLKEATQAAYKLDPSALPGLESQLGYYMPGDSSAALLAWRLRPKRIKHAVRATYVNAETGELYPGPVLK